MSKSLFSKLSKTSKLFEDENIVLILNDIFSKFNVLDIISIAPYDNSFKVDFKNVYDEYVSMNITEDNISIVRIVDSLIESYVVNKLPSIVHTIIEGRDNGVLINKAVVDYTSVNNEDRKCISDITLNRYVVNSNSLRNIIPGYCDFYSHNLSPIYVSYFYSGLKYSIERICDIKNTFECHFVSDVELEDGTKLNMSPNTTFTYLNGNDLSPVYNSIDGFDKVSRIYDMFVGTITEDKVQDLEGFDLLHKYGITEREDEILGESRFYNNYQKIKTEKKHVL